jgi:hypothetical protein
MLAQICDAITNIAGATLMIAEGAGTVKEPARAPLRLLLSSTNHKDTTRALATTKYSPRIPRISRNQIGSVKFVAEAFAACGTPCLESKSFSLVI